MGGGKTKAHESFVVAPASATPARASLWSLTAWSP